jgi:hypothetical protein
MKRININVMTKNRSIALTEILKAINELDCTNLAVKFSVYDSSSEDFYENNKKILSQYNHFLHYRMPETNSMAQNWEAAVQVIDYDYVLTVTDRSILYKNLLIEISKTLIEENECEALCWGWDVELPQGRFNFPKNKCKERTLIINDYLNALTYYGLGIYPYFLPRGLNTALSKNIVSRLKSKFGCVYSGINPDYALAYKLMLIDSQVKFISQPLFCSKYTELSNGGKSSNELNWDYIKTVTNGEKILEKSCLKLPLCSNTIFADIIHDIDSVETNKNTIELRKKIAFAAFCSSKLELKRFQAKKIINKIQYDDASAMLEMNLSIYKSEPHSIKVIIYSYLVRFVPKYFLK